MLYSLENSPKLLQQLEGCRNSWRLFELKESAKQSASPDHPNYLVIPCTCGSAACRYCRKRIFNQIRQKLLKKGIDQSWYMFTLAGVHHPGDESNDLKRLEISFRKLIQHIKRKFKKIEYIAIKELSPSGNWHLHGFWNFRFDWYQLRDDWERYSGSKSVYLKQIYSPEGAIHYSISYMLKNTNYEKEACTISQNHVQKCTSSKQFFQKETARSLYTESIISINNPTYFIQSLKSIISTFNISRSEIKFIDFPYESDLFENYKPQRETDPGSEIDFEKLPELIF